MLLDFEKDVQIKDLQNNEMSNRNCPDKCETLIREFCRLHLDFPNSRLLLGEEKLKRKSTCCICFPGQKASEVIERGAKEG